VAALWTFYLHLRQGPNLLLFSADDDDVLFLGFDWLDTSFWFPSLIIAARAAQDDRLGLLDGYEPRSAFWTESQFSPIRHREYRYLY